MGGPHVSASGVDTHAHNSMALEKLIEVALKETKPDTDSDVLIRDKYLVSALGRPFLLTKLDTSQLQA